MPQIILSTINARYAHASFGLRYLFANLKELQSNAKIIEFILTDTVYEIVEKLLESNPKIIGLSAYIWNASEISKVINILKKVSPETIIVLGGPEASHLPFRVSFEKADFIISGEGDFEFYTICKKIIAGNLPREKFIKAEPVDLNKIELPYKFYSDEDIKNRVIYVEASRGCPFKCEFCLSSIEKTVRNFDLDKLLAEFDLLWERGTRSFKFVDRTFNLNANTTGKILEYFLSKDAPFTAHFEVIPEHFPDSVKEKLKQFPKGTLQLEVGIQTLNPKIADNIKRNLNLEKIKENLIFLENETNAHLHVDLIIGLPGETVESFGKNLDQLIKYTSAEVQLGILKKLSGTEINRHDQKYGMVYTDIPPYEILKNDLISFKKMQKMKRFARFWDLFYNSSNFYKSIRVLWETESVYISFYDFSEWIYSQTRTTWQISLFRLAELLFVYLTEVKKKPKSEIANLILADLIKIEGRKIPGFLKEHATVIPEVETKTLDKKQKRQMKHL